MSGDGTDPGYFERMYARDPDPWRFASSAYEREKYAATLAALGERRFAAGLEVGCSIGVLSRQLAERCERFLGLDVAAAAVDAAAARCAGLGGARFERGAVPADWPDGGFDLVVFSEVLYYLGEAGLRATAARTAGSLVPGGIAVLVNWLGETGAGMSGDAAAGSFIAASGLRVLSAVRGESYRLDVLEA